MTRSPSLPGHGIPGCQGARSLEGVVLGMPHVAGLRRYLGPALIVFLALSFSVFGCDDGDSGQAGSDARVDTPNLPDTAPVAMDASDFTYQLEESTAELTLWTTPATHKVLPGDRAPEERNSGLALAAARNEFEPAQLLLGPASGEVSVSIEPFSSLSAEQRVELSLVTLSDGWPEGLSPLQEGDAVSLSTERSVALWLTLYVPTDAPAGEHVTTLTLTPSGASPIAVPVTLTVFDFALPREIGFATQLNVSVQGLIPEGGGEEDAKDLLFEHRFTPKSVTWPSGFKWNITWENDRSDTRCEAFWDEPDEGDAYAIGALAAKYILGEGWNEVGFPNAMIFQFVDNQTPRPSTLCGIDRGDHYGTDAYNAEWSQFLGAVQGYLVEQEMIERAYYYVQNEPQNDTDHALAAHLCRLTRAAAPQLRIAISEEPKSEIAEDAGGACGYDIWIAHVRAFQEDYALGRQRDHGEAVWFYSLDHDPDPYFNPTRVDLQGIHARIIPWVSWRYRATGWAYYDAGRFFDGPRPGIRAELLREGIEDYEYLLLANGGVPQVGVDEPADAAALGAASSLTSWTRDADALMALRLELGRYIEGSRDTMPVLQSGGDDLPAGPIYVNFQDPSGAPSDDPLVVEGVTYQKVGWEAFDAERGWGWYGEHSGNAAILQYGYDDVGGASELQRSYLYDDYGRDNLFELALANGRYEVTVGVGRPARGYPGDPHNLTVEGVVVVDDELTTDAAPTIERTVTVDVNDGSLSLEVGGYSESAGDWAYTFLGFLAVEAVD